MGSDAITNSYKGQGKKRKLLEKIPKEVDEFFKANCCIGSYIIFPNKRINGKATINQARGFGVTGRKIDDRFDLTLECIRLFYLGKESPLYETLSRYKNFFDLFDDFNGYINFFLLQDLVDEDGNIKFYLPFDDFKTDPSFSDTDIDKYLLYKDRVIAFVKLRNKRIENTPN